MCYDISLHTDIELTREAFPKVKDQRVSLESPNQEHVLSFGFPEFPIFSRQGADLILSNMEWSVDPTYEKDPVMRKKKRIKMADMQSERVLGDTRSYWYRLRKNRCLIPVSGTYEHRAISGWANKVPYYIWVKDRSIQFLPGLYQLYESIGPNGEKIQLGSFGVLTREANEVMSNIHNDGEFKHRMPLFLTPELEQFWLSEHFTDDDMRAVFEYQLPSELLAYHPVFSVRGKKPRPDGKHKYELWNYDNLPPLGNDEPLQAQIKLF
nr:SOS response-associated peptidase family protein [uncultured Dyadobacter sp.]